MPGSGRLSDDVQMNAGLKRWCAGKRPETATPINEIWANALAGSGDGAAAVLDAERITKLETRSRETLIFFFTRRQKGHRSHREIHFTQNAGNEQPRNKERSSGTPFYM